jgi:hypothetical protein
VDPEMIFQGGNKDEENDDDDDEIQVIMFV